MIDPRRRFNKRERNALYIAADGLCAVCGVSLGGSWHADHISPFSKGGLTDLENGQALCSSCNLKKGTSMLRRHQRELRSVLEEWASSPTRPGKILCWVTPGGGKSALPVIVATTLLPRFADRICVVTPRQVLQEQMQGNFQESWLRGLLGHTLEVRQATNEVDPSRGLAGYVTTYQAIAADRAVPPFQPLATNATEFGKRRYILILDEYHHVDDGGAWHRAIRPLIERAVLTIMMTGTLERGDGKAIAELPYMPVLDGSGYTIAMDMGMPVIRYSRKDALEEQAIKPLLFEHLDGKATWKDRTGTVIDDIPLSMAGSKTQEALYTALNTDYARQLLMRCVEDWSAHRRINPRSKLLVVSATIPQAKLHVKWLKELGITKVEIATSEDSPHAMAAIKRFDRHGTGDAIDALVTVAMAYEGLDNPAITHVACLTHIRSRPWIEQMISRANRVDRAAGSYESQFGWIYAPDDELLQEIFAEIALEQEPFLKSAQEKARQERLEGAPRDATPIVPQGSFYTQSRSSDLNGSSYGAVETSILQQAIKNAGLAGYIHPMQAATLIEAFAGLKESGSVQSMRSQGPVIQTPKERERQLRESIQKYCARWDRVNGGQPGTLNGLVLAHFKKSRPDMTEDELNSVWKWVNSEYPIVESNASWLQ